MSEAVSLRPLIGPPIVFAFLAIIARFNEHLIILTCIFKVQKSEVEMKMLIFLLSRHNTWSHHPTVSVSNKDKSKPSLKSNAV